MGVSIPKKDKFTPYKAEDPPAPLFWAYFVIWEMVGPSLFKKDKFTPYKVEDSLRQKKIYDKKSVAGGTSLALRSLRSTRTTFLVILCHLGNDRAFTVQKSQI